MHTKQLIINILAIITIILLGKFLPWWTLSIITLIVGYSIKTEIQSIIYGFIIGFLSWFIVLIYGLYNGGNIIFIKMSSLLNMYSPIILITFTATLSGILGLVSSWTGWQFKKENKK